MNQLKSIIYIFFTVTICACGGNSDDEANDDTREASENLRRTLDALSAGEGVDIFIFPDSDDYSNIPQDSNNLITAEKVALGKLLFHETALATEGVNSGTDETWSCASCHHVAAGFKSGVIQGIGEGGEGFGLGGEGRVFTEGFDAAAEDETMRPDVQPITSPSVLNSAYQDVMLWNGQFGNAIGGIVNAGLESNVLSTPDTPKAENARQLSGLETQAIAGTAVHRLSTNEDSILHTNPEYIDLFNAAYPGGVTDPVEDAGKAIAAYERTILASQSPFQLWLKGDESALSDDELVGALLFFGDAGCADCHRGPALSSELGASENELFFAIGFADLDHNHAQVTGSVDDATSRGRGGFTGEVEDNYKFKVPQLYNLADSNVFGHGGSFTSIRDVVAYKNAAIPQKVLPAGTLDSRFTPLNLTSEQIDQLTIFLESGLYDPNLDRYVPESLPSANCFPVNDVISQIDLNC